MTMTMCGADMRELPSTSCAQSLYTTTAIASLTENSASPIIARSANHTVLAVGNRLHVVVNGEVRSIDVGDVVTAVVILDEENFAVALADGRLMTGSLSSGEMKALPATLDPSTTWLHSMGDGLMAITTAGVVKMVDKNGARTKCRLPSACTASVVLDADTACADSTIQTVSSSTEVKRYIRAQVPYVRLLVDDGYIYGLGGDERVYVYDRFSRMRINRLSGLRSVTNMHLVTSGQGFHLVTVHNENSLTHLTIRQAVSGAVIYSVSLATAPTLSPLVDDALVFMEHDGKDATLRTIMAVDAQRQVDMLVAGRRFGEAIRHAEQFGLNAQTVIECQVKDILARLSVMTECAHNDVIFDELRTCVNHPHANASAINQSMMQKITIMKCEQTIAHLLHLVHERLKETPNDAKAVVKSHKLYTRYVTYVLLNGPGTPFDEAWTDFVNMSDMSTVICNLLEDGRVNDAHMLWTRNQFELLRVIKAGPQSCIDMLQCIGDNETYVTDVAMYSTMYEFVEQLIRHTLLVVPKETHSDICEWLMGICSSLEANAESGGWQTAMPRTHLSPFPHNAYHLSKMVERICRAWFTDGSVFTPQNMADAAYAAHVVQVESMDASLAIGRLNALTTALGSLCKLNDDYGITTSMNDFLSASPLSIAHEIIFRERTDANLKNLITSKLATYCRENMLVLNDVLLHHVQYTMGHVDEVFSYDAATGGLALPRAVVIVSCIDNCVTRAECVLVILDKTDQECATLITFIDEACALPLPIAAEICARRPMVELRRAFAECGVTTAQFNQCRFKRTRMRALVVCRRILNDKLASTESFMHALSTIGLLANRYGIVTVDHRALGRLLEVHGVRLAPRQLGDLKMYKETIVSNLAKSTESEWVESSADIGRLMAIGQAHSIMCDVLVEKNADVVNVLMSWHASGTIDAKRALALIDYTYSRVSVIVGVGEFDILLEHTARLLEHIVGCPRLTARALPVLHLTNLLRRTLNACAIHTNMVTLNVFSEATPQYTSTGSLLDGTSLCAHLTDYLRSLSSANGVRSVRDEKLGALVELLVEAQHETLALQFTINHAVRVYGSVTRGFRTSSEAVVRMLKSLRDLYDLPMYFTLLAALGKEAYPTIKAMKEQTATILAAGYAYASFTGNKSFMKSIKTLFAAKHWTTICAAIQIDGTGAYQTDHLGNVQMMGYAGIDADVVAEYAESYGVDPIDGAATYCVGVAERIARVHREETLDVDELHSAVKMMWHAVGRLPENCAVMASLLMTADPYMYEVHYAIVERIIAVDKAFVIDGFHVQRYADLLEHLKTHERKERIGDFELQAYNAGLPKCAHKRLPLHAFIPNNEQMDEEVLTEIYKLQSIDLTTLDEWRTLNTNISLVPVSNSDMCMTTLRTHGERVLAAVGTFDEHTIRLIEHHAIDETSVAILSALIDKMPLGEAKVEVARIAENVMKRAAKTDRNEEVCMALRRLLATQSVRLLLDQHSLLDTHMDKLVGNPLALIAHLVDTITDVDRLSLLVGTILSHYDDMNLVTVQTELIAHWLELPSAGTQNLNLLAEPSPMTVGTATSATFRSSAGYTGRATTNAPGGGSSLFPIDKSIPVLPFYSTVVDRCVRILSLSPPSQSVTKHLLEVVDLQAFDGARSVHAVCIVLRLLDEDTLAKHSGHSHDKLKMVLSALVSVRLLHPLGMSYSVDRFVKVDKTTIMHALVAHQENKALALYMAACVCLDYSTVSRYDDVLTMAARQHQWTVVKHLLAACKKVPTLVTSPMFVKVYSALIASLPTPSDRLQALCACPVTQSMRQAIVTSGVEHPLLRVMVVENDEGECIDVREKKRQVERMVVKNGDKWTLTWMM